jgi:hypothetical protein
VVVKLSWSIASLTTGFSGISGNTPRSDHPVTDEPGRSDQDEKRSVLIFQFVRDLASAWVLTSRAINAAGVAVPGRFCCPC